MRIAAVVSAVAMFFATTFSPAANAVDIVFAGGRVIDPETGFDGIRNVAVEAGRIVAIQTEPLAGDLTIDAGGLVVAPGFIDLHAHGQDPRSGSFQVADGVTTALELEIGVLSVSKWLGEHRSRANYGASASHLAARIRQIGGVQIVNPVYPQASLSSEAADSYANQTLDRVALEELLGRVEEGLLEGGLGIGVGLTYVPGASHDEMFALFQLAATYQVPVFIHMRQARYMGGDLLAPLQEVLANAAATGAPLHVVHINSSLNESVYTAMELIRGARARGVDVTTEAYPYTAGSTRLESALFDDYQDDYGKLQWTETGERLTQETFEAYRKQGGWVIIHDRTEPTNAWIVAQPDIMVASDGVPFVGDFSHPRSAGTFARVLGHYVREQGTLPLMTALKKMTIDPAKRLERFAPAMAKKGRVQVGMDADLVLFDPERILDQATYALPARTSQGIAHVLVNGTFVVRDGQLIEDAFPGRPIRSELSPRPSR